MRFPVLRFGIVPIVDDASFRANLGRLCKGLGYFLGTTVEARRAATYPELVTLLSQAQVDAAWVPPVVAMDCAARGLAVPRIAMVRRQETVYHAAIFSRKDSGIRTLADLQQVRAAWVSPDSASGYLVPLASLRARGICLSRAFREHLFAGSHEGAARLVAEGKAEIGANFAHFAPGKTGRPLSSGWMESGVEADFHTVAVAGPIPTDAIVTHRSIPPEHQADLVDAFRWVLKHAEGAAVRTIFECDEMAPCGDEHLSGLRKLVRMLDRPFRP